MIGKARKSGINSEKRGIYPPGRKTYVHNTIKIAVVWDADKESQS